MKIEENSLKKQIFLVLIITSFLFSKENFYIGIQDTILANGLSLKYDFSKKVTLQGVIGGFGNITALSVRGLYKFRRKRRWNAYGLASFSSYKWNNSQTSEVGLGLGGGLEYDLRGLDSSFIPLFVNIELGVSIGNSFSNGVGLGVGIHYKL